MKNKIRKRVTVFEYVQSVMRSRPDYWSEIGHGFRDPDGSIDFHLDRLPKFDRLKILDSDDSLIGKNDNGIVFRRG